MVVIKESLKKSLDGEWEAVIENFGNKGKGKRRANINDDDVAKDYKDDDRDDDGDDENGGTAGSHEKEKKRDFRVCSVTLKQAVRGDLQKDMLMENGEAVNPYRLMTWVQSCAN